MIKNRTSEVPVARTVSRIEELLAKGGVQSIRKFYGPTGDLAGLEFQHDGPPVVTVRLPANVTAVAAVLRADCRRPRKETLARIDEQAARTAWKLMQEWIEIQMSLIQMAQAEFLQVFMPYIVDRSGISLYARLRDGGFRMLADRPEGRG